MISDLDRAAAPVAAGLDPAAGARMRKRRRWRLLLLFGAVFCVFATKMVNYVWPESIRLPSVANWFVQTYDSVVTWYEDQPWLHSCGTGQRLVTVPGAYVCTRGPDDSPWTHVFDSYALSGGRREAVFAGLSKGSLAGADDLLRHQTDVPRYRPVVIPTSDRWRADPYHSAYWRLYYYSLLPSLNLLFAFQRTGDSKYANALIALDNSYFGAESASPYAWQDAHAVAVRVMVLTYEWWELRRQHVLSVAESSAFLRELVKAGDFLGAPTHYPPELRPGTVEGAALFELGVDFPLLPGAGDWLKTARTRLEEGLNLFFNPHNATVANPYFDLYALDEYWQVYEFSRATQVPIGATFAAHLRGISGYAPYVLRPRDARPLAGASLEDTIRRHKSFTAIAQAEPAFRYVLSEGRHGIAPANTSISLPNLGQTVMRSAWGDGASFADAAYATFDLGAPGQSLDGPAGLGFSLYDNGATVLPASGPVTYAGGSASDHLYPLPSSNSVVVDGARLPDGSILSGPLLQRNGITYQSGFSPLTGGTKHLRTLIMLDKDHYLLADRLSSGHVHRYQQIFHLSPRARCEHKGLSAMGIETSGARSVTIQQLDPAGIRLDAPIGQSCHTVAYSQRARNAAYTTLISVGRPDPRFAASFDSAHSKLVVRTHRQVLGFAMARSPGRPESTYATDVRAPSNVPKPLDITAPWQTWTLTGAGSASIVTARDGFSHRALRLAAPAGGRESATDPSAREDLSRSNLQVRIKLTNGVRLRSVTLAFSNHNWSSSTRIELRDSDAALLSGEWSTVSLGRDSSLSGRPGHWHTSGGGFDWHSIDAIRLTMSARTGLGPSPAVELGFVRAIPQQHKGAVAFVFDGGYQSILPAAQALRELKMPATVGVTGGSVESQTSGYLNTLQLRLLQSQWGWNVVNEFPYSSISGSGGHSPTLSAYEQGVLDGALFLERAGLNTAPNWLLYPRGTPSDVVTQVAGRFYKFAGTAGNAPEAYPYGAPLRVKALDLHSPGGSDGGQGARTPMTSPADVIAAARDALRYHTTLIVTLHRIAGLSSDQRGYPIAAFRTILHGISQARIPVMALSQLDAMDGVPEDNRIVVRSAISPLTTLAIVADTRQRQETPSWSWPIFVLLGLLGSGLMLARARALRQRPL